MSLFPKGANNSITQLSNSCGGCMFVLAVLFLMGVVILAVVL